MTSFIRIEVACFKLEYRHSQVDKLLHVWHIIEFTFKALTVFVLNINNKENFKYGLYENVDASLYILIHINVHQKYLQIKQELFTSMHTHFVEM